LVKIIDGQPTLRIVEDLGKGAKMEGCTRPGIISPQEESGVLPTVGHVQALFTQLPRALERSQIFIQLIQTIEHRKNLGRLI
jgi:hypothetical protein